MESATSKSLLFTHSLLLGERLYLFARLRFMAAAGILVGGFVATYGVGIRGIPLCSLAGASLFLAAYNVGIFFSVRPRRVVLLARSASRRLVSVAHISILLDYLVLSYCIWLVGGARSPFLAFYLLHAILASVLLSRLAAYGHAAVGYVLLTGLVLGEWYGVLPRVSPEGAVPLAVDRDIRVVVTILFVYFLLTTVTTILTTGIVSRLRNHEQGLLDTSERLERLADLRRSFLHVVLHDLRSPVGTVVTMLEGLGSGVDGDLGEAPKRRVHRAGERLRGVLDQLRSLRVLADLETEQLEGLMTPVDLLDTVKATVADHQDAAEQSGRRLRAALPDMLPPVRGVERLLRDAVANYITNAIKYADSTGDIVVRAMDLGTMVRIEVVDAGPGISPIDQAKLFQEFTRLVKTGGRGGKVSGIGLGLSIVRRIAEAHQGRAGVESRVGQGSTFFIEVPVASRVQA